jgi:hypothetical protein
MVLGRREQLPAPVDEVVERVALLKRWDGVPGRRDVPPVGKVPRRRDEDAVLPQHSRVIGVEVHRAGVAAASTSAGLVVVGHRGTSSVWWAIGISGVVDDGDMPRLKRGGDTGTAHIEGRVSRLRGCRAPHDASGTCDAMKTKTDYCRVVIKIIDRRCISLPTRAGASGARCGRPR